MSSAAACRARGRLHLASTNQRSACRGPRAACRCLGCKHRTPRGRGWTRCPPRSGRWGPPRRRSRHGGRTSGSGSKPVTRGRPRRQPRRLPRSQRPCPTARPHRSPLRASHRTGRRRGRRRTRPAGPVRGSGRGRTPPPPPSPVRRRRGRTPSSSSCRSVLKQSSVGWRVLVWSCSVDRAVAKSEVGARGAGQSPPHFLGGSVHASITDGKRKNFKRTKSFRLDVPEAKMNCKIQNEAALRPRDSNQKEGGAESKRRRRRQSRRRRPKGGDHRVRILPRRLHRGGEGREGIAASVAKEGRWAG